MFPFCDARNLAWFVLCISADGLLCPNGAVAMLPLLCIPGSEQGFLPLCSPPSPPLLTGDSAPPLLWQQFRGDGDAESRDYFGFSDLQKQLLAAWGKGGAGTGVRVGGCQCEEGFRSWPGLGRVDRRDKGREGLCGNMSIAGLKLSARALGPLLSPRARVTKSETVVKTKGKRANVRRIKIV